MESTSQDRIAGDSFCHKARLPSDSKESCASNYRTGDSASENWNADGTVTGHPRPMPNIAKCGLMPRAV
jgi:hypothetical protein